MITFEHQFRLTPAGERLAQGLEAQLHLEDENVWARAWSAALLGDAVWAVDLVLPNAPPELLELARAQLERRAAQLLAGELTRERLQALAAVGREFAEPIVVERMERGVINRVMSTALDLVELWNDPRHADALLRLALRATGETTPAPHVRVTATRLAFQLLGPRSLTETARRDFHTLLSAPAAATEGEASFLMALIDLDRGIAQLRRCLSSKIPHARSEAACALALLGTEDAIAQLDASNASEAQIVRALLRGHTPELGPVPVGELIEWRGKQKRVYSFDELSMAHSEEGIASALEDFAKRFAQLRAIWLGH